MKLIQSLKVRAEHALRARRMDSKTLKRPQGEEGFSLVEMAVAMGIMALVMPAVVTMMTTTVQAREVAVSTTENTLSYNAFNVMLRGDIERSSAVTVEGGKTIKISKSDGTCSTWHILDDTLRKVDHDGAITQDTNWVTVADPIRNNGEEEPFSLQGNELHYDFYFGEEGNDTHAQGSASPKVAGTSPNDCW